MPISTYLKAALNEQIFNAGTAYSPPGTFYLAMFTADPLPDNSAGTEATGGSPAYARKAVAWALTTPDYLNSAAITFNLAAASYNCIGIFDASTAGNLLSYGYLNSTIVLAVDGTYVVDVGAVRALLA